LKTNFFDGWDSSKFGSNEIVSLQNRPTPKNYFNKKHFARIKNDDNGRINMSFQKHCFI